MKEPGLDAATVRAEVDPQSLLEEVDAQLRIGGAWMTENGVTQRCRLAKNQAEVTGALIELQRQGKALVKDRDTKMALWHHADGQNLPAPPMDPPVKSGAATSVHSPRAVRPLRDLITVKSKRPAPPAPSSTQESPMPTKAKSAKRGETSTPILEALRAGPMDRKQIASKTGLDLDQVSNTLFTLNKAGRIKRDEGRTWRLATGGPLPTRRNAAATRTRSAPPRKPSASAAGVNGSGPRWFLGNDGSVRLEHDGAAIELNPAQFDTLRRAHAVIKAADAEA